MKGTGKSFKTKAARKIIAYCYTEPKTEIDSSKQ